MFQIKKRICPVHTLIGALIWHMYVFYHMSIYIQAILAQFPIWLFHIASTRQRHPLVMVWQCPGCSRYWGGCWRYLQCPLCKVTEGRRTCLLLLWESLNPQTMEIIAHFAALNLPVKPLPKCSLCHYGTPLNCRCARCKCPAQGRRTGGLAMLLEKFSTKYGRGRAVEARWVYLVIRKVGREEDGRYNALDGLLLVKDNSTGPACLFLKVVPSIWAGPTVGGMLPAAVMSSSRAFIWFMSLFMQYTENRRDVPGMVGTSTLVYLRPDALPY